MAKGKDVLTTGDVARICHVAPRTVTKWFDKGQLNGYRIPGSKDRRIPVSELIRFMKVHNMSTENLDSILGNKIRILIVDDEVKRSSALKKRLDSIENFEVQIANTGYQAGTVVFGFLPHVILVHMFANIKHTHIIEGIRGNEGTKGTKIIAIADSFGDSAPNINTSEGYDDYAVTGGHVIEDKINSLLPKKAVLTV